MKPFHCLLILTFVLSCKQNKERPATAENIGQQPTVHIPKEYSIAIKEIAIIKKKHQQEWAALSKPAKEKIFTEAVCKTIIPSWYGTAWSFNGMSEIPGKGSIACGYFVTTTLRDAGLPLQRIKLAQSASQVIIESLTAPVYVKRFSNTPIKNFVEYIHQKGYGLYIVGLDTHVGFIYNDGKEVYFIHANYAGKREVIKEIAIESYVLTSSKYRIAGKISADEKLLNWWITAP